MDVPGHPGRPRTPDPVPSESTTRARKDLRTLDDLCADDDYWRIRGRHPRTEYVTVKEAKETMKKRGFYWKSSERKGRAMELYERCERGLVSYEACKRRELESFVKQRGISYDRSAHKSDLVGMLELADDTCVFYKFLDLPAEMRSIIFTMYMEGLVVPGDKACQPPLCLTSRQLRHESLPLFYQVSAFSFSLYENCKIASGAPRMVVEDNSTDLLYHTSDTNLAKVKRLNVELLRWASNGTFDTLTSTTWDIDFSTHAARRATCVKVEAETLAKLETGRFEEWMDTVSIRLAAFAERISTRTKPVGLQQSDIALLVKTCDVPDA